MLHGVTSVTSVHHQGASESSWSVIKWPPEGATCSRLSILHQEGVGNGGWVEICRLSSWCSWIKMRTLILVRIVTLAVVVVTV